MMRSLARGVYRAIPMKQPVFEVVRRVARLPERVYRHLGFKGAISIEAAPGRTFRIFHHGYQVENDLFWAGFGNGWEATSLRLWVRLAARHRTILDIGANTGVYALAAKTVNPDADVYAFEPVERVHARLERNIALNGFDIAAIRAGLSNRTGTATFFDTSTDHVYSASLNPDMLAGRNDLVETTIEVVRADDFLADRPVGPSLLAKIDTEKHELEVFEGFGDLIATRTPTFLVEILNPELGHGIAGFFAGRGYAYYEIVEGEAVQRVDTLGGSGRNYLICTRQAADAAGLGDGLPHGAL